MGKETFNGALNQLHTHEQDEERDDEGGQIFGAPMTEGMLRIRFFAGQKEPRQGDEGGAGVTQVVEAVRLDGKRASEHAQNDFEHAQQQIQTYADTTADHAVFVTDNLRIVRFAQKNFGQQSDHEACSLPDVDS